MNAQNLVAGLAQSYRDIWQRLDEIATDENYFEIFKALSDNYSPTLTVSRTQGGLVKKLLSEHIGPGCSVEVDPSLRRSGSIGITLGQEPAPVWFTGHADICSYLTGECCVHEDGRAEYALSPFCVPRAEPGRRAAVAVASPSEGVPLKRLAKGEMVTLDNGSTIFETDVSDLPAFTRVVYDIEASWNRENDEIYGYIDNQGMCAALILAARVLSHYPVNVLMVLNDEEEGPVDRGNQGFSRAMLRLLNRTPLEKLPEGIFNGDLHQQETLIDSGRPSQFGTGALFAGMSSNTRGAVVPPQLIDFARDLSAALAPKGIDLTENRSYVSRSDDISAMQFTQGIMLFGFAGTSSHFNGTPTMRCSDLVNLTKVLVVYALLVQDEGWRAQYL